ncbi:unnamed protein product, partial [marine sediment metagenome]
MNNDYPGQYNISAKPGSTFILENCIIHPKNEEYSYSILIENSTFRMSNCEINHAGYLSERGDRPALHLSYCNNVILINNSFTNLKHNRAVDMEFVNNSVVTNNECVTKTNHYSEHEPQGFFIYNCKNNTYSNNYISACLGFSIRGSVQNNFINNIIEGGPSKDLGSGFQLEGDSNNNVFINNTIYGPEGCTGFRIFSLNNLVYNNKISDIGYGIVVIRGSGNIIANNDIERIYKHDGILLYRSHDNYVINNNISTALEGITLANHACNNIIYGNTVTDCERGISLHFSSNNNTISYNTVADSRRLYLHEDWSVDNIYRSMVLHNSSGNHIYSNNFLDGKGQAYDDGENNWSLNGKGNFWGDYAGPDINKDGIGDATYNNSHGVFDPSPQMNLVPIASKEVP